MEKIKCRELKKKGNLIIEKWINKNYRIQKINGGIILRDNWKFREINLYRTY